MALLFLFKLNELAKKILLDFNKDMENEIYPHLNISKINKKIIHEDIDGTLTSLFQAKDSFEFSTEKKIYSSYCIELREILSEMDLLMFIKRIFSLNSTLEKIHLKNNFSFLIPSLESFYKSLSPTILRLIWESFSQNDSLLIDSEGVLEAVRVAIEEELYTWQEKVF